MQPRAQSNQTNIMRSQVKKFLVYDEQKKDEWEKFKVEFSESAEAVDDKINCLVRAAKVGVINAERYAQLAFIIAEQQSSVEELMLKINLLPINHSAKKMKNNASFQADLTKHFYNPLIEHIKKSTFSDSDKVRLLSLISTFFNEDQKSCGDMLAIMQNALRKDLSVNHDVLKLLKTSYTSFISQLREQDGLVMLYLAILKRLKKSGIKSADLIDLLITDRANSFGAIVFSGSNKIIIKRYIKLIKQFDTKQINYTCYPLFGFTFAAGKSLYPKLYAKSDFRIINNMIKYRANKKIILQFILTRNKRGKNFIEALYLASGFRLIKKLMAALIKHSIINAEDQLAILNPALLCTEYGIEKNAIRYMKYVVDYFKHLLSIGVDANKVFSALNLSGLEFTRKIVVAGTTYPDVMQDYLELLMNLLDRGSASANALYSLSTESSLFHYIINSSNTNMSNYFTFLKRLIDRGVNVNEICDLLAAPYGIGHIRAQLSYKPLNRNRYDWVDNKEKIELYGRFLIDLYLEDASINKIHALLSKNYALVHYNRLFQEFCSKQDTYFGFLMKQPTIAGKVLFELQSHGLIPPNTPIQNKAKLIFDHINTLPDNEKKAAYQTIKDKSTPLAPLFWQQKRFLFFYLHPALRANIAKKIEEEESKMPSLIDSTDDEKEVLLEESVFKSFQQTTPVNDSIELVPLYPSTNKRLDSAYEELENLSPPSNSLLANRGLYAKNKKDILDKSAERKPLLQDM